MASYQAKPLHAFMAQYPSLALAIRAYLLIYFFTLLTLCPIFCCPILFHTGEARKVIQAGAKPELLKVYSDTDSIVTRGR